MEKGTEAKKNLKIVDNMEAGEKELRLIFEEVTRGNVQAAITYSEETRKLVRNLEEHVKILQNTVLTQNNIIEGFRIQLANIQTMLYSGGTVGQ
jgi:uncharacterized protein (DUF433 family)